MAKIEISPFAKETLVPPCGSKIRSKNSLDIALSLTVFEIFTLFHFPQKSKMAAESGENLNFTPLQRRLLYHPVALEIALSLTVFVILTLIHFPQKSKMAAESGENLNFTPLQRRLLYHPVALEIALSLTVFEILTLFHFP